MKKHPIQPLVHDKHGRLRFKENAIVRFCVDNIGLNKLAAMDFSREDWDQLGQLIGYSHAGAPSYISEETIEAAMSMHAAGISEADARIQALEGRLHHLASLLNGAAECLNELQMVREDFTVAALGKEESR